MRELDPNFYAALLATEESGGVSRQLVTFTGSTWPDADGNVARSSLSFWTDDDDVDIAITSQTDNTLSTRTFLGGVNLNVGRIVRSSTMKIQTVTVSLSANAPAVQQLTRGLNMHLATVEIWDAALDPRSLLLAGTAPAYLGVVDGAPINTEAENGEEVVEFNVVNDLMVMLTRPNSAKASDEEQRQRLGADGSEDRFNRYTGSVKDWNIPWGEK